MVHPASPSALTGLPYQEATEVRNGGERRLSPPAPEVDCAHEMRVPKAAGCRPRSFGGSEAQACVVGVSSRGRGEARNTHLRAEPRSAGNEETWTTPVVVPPEDHAVIPAATAVSVLANATEVEKGSTHPLVAPGQGVRPPGTFRHHGLPLRSIRPWKRWPTVRAPRVFHPHRHRVGGIWPGHEQFWRRIVSVPDAFSPFF